LAKLEAVTWPNANRFSNVNLEAKVEWHLFRTRYTAIAA